MDRSLLAFRSKLEQSSVGLFFFAGHGIQCKGENFLATKDTNFVDEISCRHTSFPLNDVIDIFEESKVTTKIFISQPRIKNDGLCFDISDKIVVDVNVAFFVIVHGIAFADLNFLNQAHQRGTV